MKNAAFPDQIGGCEKSMHYPDDPILEAPKCVILAFAGIQAPVAVSRMLDSRLCGNGGRSPLFFEKIPRNFSKKGGTRPPSPREVNSRGSSPAVGRFAPSGLPSLFPRLIEMIRYRDRMLPTSQTMA